MSPLGQFYHQLKVPSSMSSNRKWVFLHGLMGYSANWSRIIYNLSDSETTLCFDQRGHGRSIKPESGYRSEDYAHDLYQILDELKWDQIELVGHSMGGRNALVFANLFPQKIRHLVIEDIGPDGNPDSILYYQKMLESVPTPFQDRDSAKKFFQTQFFENFKSRENQEILSQFLFANLGENQFGQWDWRFSKSAIYQSVENSLKADFWSEFKKCSVPTLLIRGSRSKELSRELFEEVLKVNPNIKGVEISNAGHWVHADQPQEFTDVLKDFVGVGRTGSNQ